MPLKIRCLKPSDLNAVVEIASQSPCNAWDAAVFADCLKASYTTWVAEVDDAVSAFLVALTVQEDCQLMNIGVDIAHQRVGIASALMTHLLQFAKLNACDQVFLEVRASNKGAIALYEKFGFKQVGVRVNYYPADRGREDALTFQLRVC